jgi:hypothetical protein
VGDPRTEDAFKTKGDEMKTMTALVSAAALLLGVAAAIAQGAGDAQAPRQQPGATQGTNPSGNPAMGNSTSPTSPTTSGAANPGSTRSMDEQANGTGQAVERNPDGSPGGSRANPSPR